MRRLWRALEKWALDLFHVGLIVRAQDRSERLQRGSCLLLAPHPDDETLGCGGLAARRRAAGQEVHVAIAADGAASHAREPTRAMTGEALAALRRRETLAACARLGIPGEAVVFFDLPDGRLAEMGDELERRIGALIDSRRPADVFVCALIDGHPDHKALNRALRRLIERGEVAADVFEYPVWAFDFRSWRVPGRSNKSGFALGVLRMARFVLRSPVVSLRIRETLGRKRDALLQHRSQLGLLEEEPGWSGLPEEFVSRFFRSRELYFPLQATAPRASRPEPR